MAIIKYYNLESQSQDIVSELERNLQKHLLNGKHIKGLLTTSVEEIAEAQEGNGKQEDVEKLVYDSGDFDVLYKDTWTISKGKKAKTKLFGKDIPKEPARIGTELVIKAIPGDILKLQDYLSSSGFEVVEARAISQATLSFATKPCHPAHSKSYEETLKRTIDNTFATLKIDVSSHEDIVWEDNKCGSVSGIVYGDVADVLKFRNILKNSASSYGTKIFRESVTFSQ